MKEMEIESVKCDCCSLKEDCTQDYIAQVRLNFEGKWLCGLCAEAVRDELSKALDIEKSRGGGDVREAMRAHTKFCQRFFQSNPAVCVADGMRQMLRRRSGDFNSVVVGAGADTGGAGASSKGPSKKHHSPMGSQVGDESSLSF
ncbi:hypothetical protein QJS04_geneDACA023427 [Acorus gramineus]|uniref:Uncharacterized protein n=1 Tax=Acorus gramineus TaxID=55184 RepID=A0AAV9BPB6_ACOGR|nr:hypothetical protein QJS04_geneDACA009495 [Acorus gramineus]KAK1278565.1 hypothetical protein QJS04_geneDACA023427 [Acorus gramineus]